MAKFQLFDASKEKDSPWFDWLTTHELTYDQAKMLFDYGQEIGIEVFFSVFDPVFVPWCENIGVKRYKIACDFGDMDILEAIHRTGKEVIVSIFESGFWWENNTALYCIPNYPAEAHFSDDTFDIFNGFSDHTIGIDAAKIALARGAQIIEKHFILDRAIPAPDAPWSMTPDELAELVRWEKVCREVIN